MAKTYYTVLTTYGSQQVAAAMANNRPLSVTHFAVGDGNGRTVIPDSTRTALVREVHRAAVSGISLDPRNDKQVVFELTLPESVGGFWIREMGLFDSTGRMIAYANCPESFKPRLEDNSGKVQVLRMILLVSSSNAVTLTVDNRVIWATRGQLTPKKLTANTRNEVQDDGHTHEIEHGSTTTRGLMQLTNDTGLDSEHLGLSAKGGKAIAQSVAQLQQRVNDGLNQKFNKNDISDSVASESRTQVASSKAAKTAYDKGAEALNRANQVFEDLSNSKAPLSHQHTIAEIPELQAKLDTINTKQDALVEHVLDLRDLDQSRWYPVLMRMPRDNKMYQFRLIHVLGADKPSWSGHQVGFGVRCEWEVIPSGWGVWNWSGSRLITHFEYIHCEQSPLLNLGQIAQENKEYVYLRGGARYWLYAEPGVTVEISRSDYHGQDPTGQYRWHIPMLHAYDASLVPKPIRQYLDEIGTKADRATTLAGYGITNGMPVGWLGEENLNDVITFGFYGQDVDYKAIAERNYPKVEAGTLWVTPSANGVQQEYTCYNTNHKYVRGRVGSEWQSWRRLVQEGDFVCQRIGDFEVHKYPNGTMIQSCIHRQGGASYDRHFSDNTDAVTLIYPVAFVEVPTVNVTPHLSHPYSEKSVYATNNPSHILRSPHWEANNGIVGLTFATSRTQIGYTYSNAEVYINEMSFHILAVGRWK